MAESAPTVSIGMPVYNGERYLEQTLESIFAQSYTDFELIISDNASTDRTQEICEAYAARYSCVRYYRNDTNIGGFRNHNRVIDLSYGKYFHLAPHDDLRDPQQLEKCVQQLEANSEFVLCYSKTTYIDENDQVIDDRERYLDYSSSEADERFKKLIGVNHKVEPVNGVIRRSALTNVRFGQFADSDRVFVAELSLHGPFYRIPERLIFRRHHAKKSTVAYPSRYQFSAWCNPGKRNLFVFPYISQCLAYFAAVRKSPLPFKQKLRCYRILAGWTRRKKSRMLGDLKHFFINSFRRPREESY